MMIEQNTNYAYKLKYMDNPNFDKVRDLSTKFYRELPQALQDELYEALNRGIDILDSEPQMTAYLFAYSKMHKAKLNYAFEHLPETFFEIPEINIIDYGCGQAVATMCYADFLRRQGYEQKIRRVTLIEPSEAALKRAALHVSVFFPDAEIVTINKVFDDLETKDIVCDEDVPTLHLLSNVLDLECFSLITFKKLVKNRIGSSNLFVCVGPYFGDKDRGKRMDSFAKHFKGEEIFSEDLDAYELDANNSWTCMVRCFGVGDLEYSISDKTLSTEVTDEDIENGIEDEFGVIYSKDGKRLLSAKHFDCKTYTINKGIKVICDRAFYGCVSLQSISIPNSVTNIGDYAFMDSKSLQSLVIPDSVTNIGDSVFLGCKSLKSLVIPNSVINIGNEVFSVCESLQSLVISDGVTSIGNGAFIYCKSLQSIVIPTSVTSIGNWAFADCYSLPTIIIPENVTSIGVNPFSRSGIRSIVCHSKSFKVDGKALYDRNMKHMIAFYSDDTHFDIPDSVTSIGVGAFLGKFIQSIVIPSSVTSIGEGSFSDCESLQIIIMSKSVTTIGNSAFKDCSSLKSIVIPDSVTNIENGTFSGCTSLKSIVIPDSVSTIGNSAFMDCESLQSVVISGNVTSIGRWAFERCYSLQSIVIPDSVSSIGEDAFKDSSLKSIVIPDSVTNIENGTFSGCTSLKSIVIPDSVTNIENDTFSGCTSLQSIIIPDSVKSIGNSTFFFCKSLQSIVIPDSVSSIGEEAFRGCTSLRAIIIPKGSRKKFEKLLPDDIDKLVER